jgi:hypothetical protein
VHNAGMHGTRRSAQLPVLAAIVAIGGLPEADAAEAGERLAVPAAAGSLGPNLAAGPDGELVLSWMEPVEGGHRLVWSRLDGGWSPPTAVARGDDWFVNWADFPSVVPLTDGLWAAHWLVSQPAGGYAYDVYLSVSTDSGLSWSEPIIPHRDGTPSEHGFVSLFAHPSGFGALWLDGRKTIGEFAPEDVAATGMTLRAATFTSALAVGGEAEVDGLVCDCCQTDAAVAASGPVAVYRDRSGVEVRDISVARLRDGAWEAGRALGGEGWELHGCPVNGPAIDARGNDVAVAWFTASSGEPRVRVARSHDSGDSFGSPVDVAIADNYGRVQVAMLEDGGLAVSWLCKRAESAAALCLRRVPEGEPPGPVRVLGGDGSIPPLSVPQLARQGDMLVAAWTAREDGTTRIASARLPADSL